ncbi:TLD domain containing protein [Nitzschia inconspicua]|uniref:TLD domain containing protein n=1 Tax=Nitzschia inconspicua TaxID=303405 RepID=A0A9K3PYF5_9STRA|nr:TLD domain containing protein [Nitzschia inconspicua]
MMDNKITKSLSKLSEPIGSSSNEDGAALLIARLSSQFGDLDLNQLHQSLRGKYSPSNSIAKNNIAGDEEFHQNDTEDLVASSEESSLAEPTPEELAAWQAQQFRRGKETLLRQKEGTMAPIQKRRLALRHKNPQTTSSIWDDGDWEELSALPDLQGQSSLFFGLEGTHESKNSKDDPEDAVFVGVAPLLLTLATSPKGDPELLGTAWNRLYSSMEKDGLSFFNLCHEICNYDGPTLMILSVVPSKSKMVASDATIASQSAITSIGFFTTTTWQESPEYYGNYSDHDRAFLFAMDEQHNRVEFFNMQKPNVERGGSRGGFMYCHPSTKSFKRLRGKSCPSGTSEKGINFYERTDGAVYGIGIGGKPSQPRLHLTETLEECRCLTYDSSRTLQDGNLFLDKPAFESSLYYFDVDSIEVWGVGGKAWIRHALEAREQARAIAASNLEQRRRIYDKTQMLDDFRNGLYSTTTKSEATGSYFDHVLCTSDHCDT